MGSLLEPLRDLFGFAFPLLENLPAMRAILGVILVFFLPGFAWTLVFFRQIPILERIVLSIALSIVVVTLSVLALNRVIGMRISGFNAVLVIGTITSVPLMLYFLKRVTGRQGDNAA